ncbi:MAG: WG repeat-containing protein [Candidatus Cloacimonetes bacterium]|nr:WG repeat-containing protein [Candidatus Cloacimonadota bacterium]
MKRLFKWLIVLLLTAGCIYLSVFRKECLPKNGEPILFKNSATDKYALGIVTEDGKEIKISDYSFDEIGKFNEGYAPASVRGKWGLINKQAKFIIQPKYKFIGEFSQGAIPFRSLASGLSGHLNIQGKVIVKPQYYATGKFSEGLAYVRGIEKKFGYVNLTGELVIPMLFKYADSFNEGFAIIQLDDNSWNFINKQGEFLSKDSKYTEVHDFKSGFAIVKIGNECGVINSSGTEVLSGYEDVHILGDNYMAGRKNGKWGILNGNGDQLLPYMFDLLEFEEKTSITNYKHGYPQCNLVCSSQTKPLQVWLTLSNQLENSTEVLVPNSVIQQEGSKKAPKAPVKTDQE